MPGLVVHLHVHQHVAGEELTVAAATLTVAHLHHFLGRNEDVAEIVVQATALDALLEQFLDLLLEARVRMHHVQALDPFGAHERHLSA